MDSVRIVPAGEYTGEGISNGLARGLLVYCGDRNITGEGMGIGSVALRNRSCTFFSRTWTDTGDDGVHSRTFSLDTRMIWSIRKRPSLLLTRWIESGISIYMAHPRIQGIAMLPVHTLRRLLDIHPRFETIPSRGTVTFTYRIAGTCVDVQAEARVPLQPHETLCLLNELSAAWFTKSWEGDHPADPPPGWEAIAPDRLPAALFSPAQGIRFFLEKPSASPPAEFTIFRGREQSADLSWAGFCLELGSREGSLPVTEVRYRIGFAPGARS